MSPKRILLIIPEMSMGGAQRSLAKLSLALAKDNHVWIAIFNMDHPVAYPCGGEIMSLEVAAGRTWWGKFRAFNSRVRKLKEVKAHLKIDVAISFLEGADYVNVLSKINERIILSVRGSKLHDENMHQKFYYLRRYVLIPRLYAKAARIVAVNYGIARELQESYKIKVPVNVIYNFYDLTEIKTLSEVPLPATMASLYDSPVLVITGRLSPEKNISFLIRVFHKVVQRLPTIRLMIVGDGPEYDDLVVLCRQLKLTVQTKEQREPRAKVIFAGNQDNVFSFLLKGTIYLMASSAEGFPNGMVEAMACSLPVMAADCPYGPREILAPGTEKKLSGEAEFAPYGILMPMANENEKVVETWENTIKKFAEDPQLRNEYAKQSFARAGHFSAEQAMELWKNEIGN